MGDAARVGVLLGNAQSDNETAFWISAIEQRPDRVEKRTGAEQRRETGRGIRVTHGVIPVATALLHQMPRPPR